MDQDQDTASWTKVHCLMDQGALPHGPKELDLMDLGAWPHGPRSLGPLDEASYS